MEDNLWLMTTFGGGRPRVEDNLCWKTAFGGRQPWVEDDLGWKTNLDGKQPSVEDDLQWILACCLVRFASFFLKYPIFEITNILQQNWAV